MSEQERAVHVEGENLREEINRNRQEVSRSEKRLKERADEHLAKNLSRMTRQAEQRELRLRDDLEKLRIQQDQNLGTLDTKIDAIMERLENRPRGPNIRGSSTGNRPTSNERPTQDIHATERCDSMNWSHANQGRSHSSDSNRRENPEPLSGGNDAQAGHSRDATSMATTFEPLNRCFETFLTRLSRTSERSEKSRRVF